MSTSEPGQCVGTIALVREVIAASTSPRSMLRVTRSQSTKTGVAPTVRMQLAEAIKEKGVEMTSSPGPMLSDCRTSCRPLVPELTATP